MSRFNLRIVEGSSTPHDTGASFWGMGANYAIEAASRVEAFILMYRQLTREGRDVTVLDVKWREWPLGFSREEAAVIAQAGIEVKPGFPQNGFQIETLEEA